MVKVIKSSDLELAANFEEVFDGATVQEATEKAFNQKMPSESAKVNITDTRLIKAHIKVVGELENDGSK
jgi:hypothetical protein